MIMLFTLTVTDKAFAAEAVESGICGADKLVISGEGEMTNEWRYYLEVPWVGYQDKITEIQIEEGVTNIGSYAFAECTKMKKVNIAQSVTRIEGNAFNNCRNLQSIKLPNQLKYIGDSAFSLCNKLNMYCSE